jgi:DNA-binding beta-propeller fold protein YncE
MDYGPMDEEDIGSVPVGEGLFVINEGNFMYGNASLTYYIPSQKHVENEIFARANGQKLGDVAQSMVIRNGLGYIVVNNSGVIYVIDTNTFKVKEEITGFVSPRYIHFLNDTKAYVTDLYARQITIINPQTFKITGRIDIPEHESTEQMVQYDKYVFVNCWSYDNKILVIDSEQDIVVDSIQVGIQPTSLIIDKYNKIWTITDGGYEGSPYGYEAPSLYRIDAASRTIEKEFKFKLGEHPSEICINGSKDSIYFINKSIWKMDVTDNKLPIRALIEYKGTIYYGLTVDPTTSEVYVADAIDYRQSGTIYRYSPQAELLDSFKAGIIPGHFVFK